MVQGNPLHKTLHLPMPACKQWRLFFIGKMAPALSGPDADNALNDQ